MYSKTQQSVTQLGRIQISAHYGL